MFSLKSIDFDETATYINMGGSPGRAIFSVCACMCVCVLNPGTK